MMFTHDDQERGKDHLDLVIETVNGTHILLATVSNQAHGLAVGSALYQSLREDRTMRVRYVWLRGSKAFRNEDAYREENKILLDHIHLLYAWPHASEDPEGHAASLAAWKSSPRGISGDESEPEPKVTIQTLKTILARLPERYHPTRVTHEQNRYTVRVDQTTTIAYNLPAREAIKETQSYVDDHEQHQWQLPTGVIHGNYD